MVSSTGSQVESAIFQRVIGSLGSDMEVGGGDRADGVDDQSVYVEDGGPGGVADMENSPDSGIECTNKDAVRVTSGDE